MKLVKNSIIYSTVTLLQKATGFFLLPVYTAYLTTTEYGVVSVVTSLVGFYSIFYVFSLNAYGSRQYYENQQDEENAQTTWGTITTVVFLNSIALTVLLVYFKDSLLLPFAKGIDFFPCLVLGLVSIALNPLFTIFQTDVQTRQNGRKFGLNNLVYFLTNLGLTILFVVVFRMKALGVLLSLTMTSSIFFIYTLIDYIPRIKIGLDKKVIRESFKYSLPLVPHSLSGWFASMIDKIFLNSMKSASAVGVYSIGYQFGTILNLLSYSINQAYIPWFFEKLKLGDHGKSTLIHTSELLILAYSFCALLISLFTPEVLSIMVAKDFRSAWLVVPFLTFAGVFSGLYYIAASVLFVNHTFLVPFVSGSSAICSVLLNWLLIPKFGIIGAAIANMLSMLTASVTASILSSRVNKIGFKWFRLYSIVFVSFLFSLVIFMNEYVNHASLVICKALIILVYGSYLLWKYSEQLKEYYVLLMEKYAFVFPTKRR